MARASRSDHPGRVLHQGGQKMHIAVIGLGRMGMNIARRLVQEGHRVIAYNRSPEKTKELEQAGGIGAFSLSDVAEKLSPPRIVWIMLPAGQTVDDHIDRIKGFLSTGDIIIDGGNSFYKDDIRRAEALGKEGIAYMDIGVSGGIWGLQIGYCLMVGGAEGTCRFLEPLLRSLAPDDGYLYCGPSGAGHFVKMVHNGIEYAIMEAYGEGFNIMEASPYSTSLRFSEVAHLWNHGSVIRSWLLELAEAAFAKNEKLADIKGYVEESGEGRWTVQQAIETKVSAPVIALSLMRRFRSQEKESFADKVVAALRRDFGGHAVRPAEPKRHGD
ncbi:MAG: decarboxylating 6-phosphogluconate dehydrogenase [Deltaproteobacteria bacterium]|nr:decarboxylating 6-phosphogluconate dehydrogenase [Deltaproteobacteria bacterium]